MDDFCMMNDFDSKESHNRVIIHIDMDCYYAQVEEILNPDLKDKPLGVHQKNFVVTANYNARKFGITKMMTIIEAQKLCPELVLVNGEDLTKYKQMSVKIFDILLKYTPLVEKLGLDENYMDVTEIVNKKLSNIQSNYDFVEGCVYPLDNGKKLLESGEYCMCGCSKRLLIATHIARDIRQELYDKLNLTCCAGIAHNKLLAKLIGNMNKPNNQTTILPMAGEKFMRELNSLKKITGIGIKTELLLKEIQITNIEELQNCDMDLLRKKFGFETAVKLKECAFGRDKNPVRTTGKPKSIGLEDSCRPLSVRKDVEERFRLLLMRLVNQVAEDGRIPVTIKVILRKFDAIKRTSHRETKQSNISPSLFKYLKNQIVLVEDGTEKLLKIIMKLFERCIDMEKPFNITLLGLAFSKFQERKQGSSSIANFLIKKTDLEVQSVMSLKSDGVNVINADPSCSSSLPLLPSPSLLCGGSVPADDFYRRRMTSSSPVSIHAMDVESVSSDISDFSENEVEPSPKKSRLGLIFANAKRRCISPNDMNDIASPSKLRVAELRLNSRDSDKETAAIMKPILLNSTSPSVIGEINNKHDKIATIQSFLEDCQQMNSIDQQDNKIDKIPLLDTIDGCYSSSLVVDKNSINHLNCSNKLSEYTNTTPAINDSVCLTTSTTTINGTVENIPCPSGVDPNVFKELPVDVQSELISSWRTSLSVRANSTNISQPSATATAATTAAATGGTTSANTLHRYFIRNN